MIERLQSDQLDQEDLDKWYEHFCQFIYDKVGKENRSSNQNSNTRNKPKYPRKPDWNEELHHLWQAVHKAEHSFLKYEGTQSGKKVLLKTFKECQYVLDKTYRKYKRFCQRGQLLHFERVQTSNPQSFWREINKLGPIRTKKIPMEVLGHDGNLVNELA